MDQLALLAVSVLVVALASKRLRTTPLTGPMVFVMLGLLAGPEVADLVTIAIGEEQVIVLAEAALAVVLFADAARLDLRSVRRDVGLPVRLLALGLPLSMALGTVAARVLLGLDWTVSALVGAILAATDAALGQAVLTDDSVPSRISNALNVESGLNDGLALPAVTLFATLADSPDTASGAGGWLRFVVEQVAFGAAAGVALGAGGGWLLVRARRAGWVDAVGSQLGALSIVALAYAAAEVSGGNTFIAAFAAGLALRFVAGDDCPHLIEFAEDGGQLLAAASFVVFGNALVGPALGQLTVPIALYVVLSLTVVRMVPTRLALLGEGLALPSWAFIGWFGPRGLASILFVVTVVAEAEKPLPSELFTVVSWTVLASVVLHGASASALARRYGDWYATTSTGGADMMEGPLDPHRRMRTRWQPRS